ncbi:ubiquitin-associated protein 2 isoform X2 [Nematostella vectensis]|uniref:ubiquitin-associated protein 2 isoform X2 n=1 Tax=Nematostella vectensis TaxID=45351 RepID=UPI002076FC98|nr:ubiquitin-associated protein 2 isoform X2 [Nematostella vectensis]
MKGGTQAAQNMHYIPQTDQSHTKKPTAEQLQYAKLLNNEDQKHIQDQLKQVADMTGRSIDEASVALHDCNYDTEQAINTLFEGKVDQSEWIVSNRKKKHQGGSSQGLDNIMTSQTGSSSRTTSRPSRGGRGGRNRSSDKSGFDSDHRDDNGNVENGRGRGSREDRSSDRRAPGGRGGPPRKGRGGGRGRLFPTRGRAGRLSSRPSAPASNGPTENGTELWDINDNDSGKEKTEMWEDLPQGTEDWGQDEWTPSPVAETTTPGSDSLFSSAPPSSSWPDREQGNKWGDNEPTPSSTSNGTALSSGVIGLEESREKSFTPESVDVAIIHSKLAQNQTDSSPNPNPLLMRIPLPGEMSRHNNHLGPIGKLLENANVQSNNQAVPQPQAQRQPRQNRPKKTPKSQIPEQAVEMPGSMADSLDVQFGNLEFGGDAETLPRHQTKGMDSSAHLGTEESREPQQSEIPSVKPEPEERSLPTSLPSSLSRTVPITTAATTSASGMTMVEDNTQRHYQHHRAIEKSHIPEPIPLPNQMDKREAVLQQQPDHTTAPSALSSSATAAPSLGGSRNQVPSQSSLTQLASSLSKESSLDSRAYQNTQLPVATQQTYTSKEQLASVGLGHHSTLGSAITAASLQRKDLSATSSLPPPPPPGVPITSLHATAGIGLSTVTVSSSSRPNQHSCKPNLPPGVLPMNTLYGMQQPGLVPAYSLPYGYEDLQRLQMSGYYNVPFQTQGREALQGTYQADQKFGRSDASSPVQTTMNQAATPGQHHLQQQAYMNAAMPHPYGYGGLAFYPGSGMLPSGFPAYTAPMYQQMPTKTHGTTSQYQQQAYSNQHGSHSFNTGYDDLSGGSHDYGKSAYHLSVSQPQSKSNSVTSSSGDLGGSSYKAQFGDSKAFLGSTPPPALNLNVQGQHGHMSNYPTHTAPFMNMMPQAQQHHQASIFHHHQQQQQQHHLPHHHQEMSGGNLSQRGGGQQSQLGKQSQSKGYPGGFWSSANKSL